MQAFKTRIHLNDRQAGFMRQCFDMRRFAYNWALQKWSMEYCRIKRLTLPDFVGPLVETESDQRDAYLEWRAVNPAAKGKNIPQKYRLPDSSIIDKQFNAWKAKSKADLPWLYSVPSCVGQVAIKKHLDAAFKRFYKGSGFPRFKKRGANGYATFSNAVVKDAHLNGNYLTLPSKMGIARLAEYVRCEGRLQSVTVSESGGKFYAAFLFEADMEPLPQATTDESIGIDVGVAKYATLSDGSYIEDPQAPTVNLERLARLQRALSRKTKHGENCNKKKFRINRLHGRIADIRKDGIEQATARIVNKYPLVVVEDLNLQNMTASAKGTSYQPGKRIRQKAGLNRSLLDSGLYQFRTRLESKLQRHGGTVIAVPPAYTSQICSACGSRSEENRKSQAVFVCVACGHAENADVNAAKNILRAGLFNLD